MEGMRNTCELLVGKLVGTDHLSDIVKEDEYYENGC
jgi:hypothetical protein